MDLYIDEHTVTPRIPVKPVRPASVLLEEMMRMLTEEERFTSTGEGDVIGTFPQDDQVFDVERELERFGRGVWVESEDGICDFVPTEMGLKALRVDALIREWGLGP